MNRVITSNSDAPDDDPPDADPDDNDRDESQDEVPEYDPLATLAEQEEFVIGTLAHNLRRRMCDARATTPCGLLDWAKRYLPAHFQLPPSAMHRWLAEQIEASRTARGQKINVIGPRGAAKSTVASLACPLRLAVEAAEPYIWIVSDTKDQAASHLENIKSELIDNELLAADYPDAVGKGGVWRSAAIRLRNGVTIEAFGTGQRIRGRRRRANRPTLIVCDDLQNDGHIESSLQREHSRRWFHGTLIKAGTHATNVLHLATALHHDALGLELTRTPGWTSRIFRAIERWPEDMATWNEWEAIYTALDKPECRQLAREFYEARTSQLHEGCVLLWPEHEDLYTLMQMRVEGGRTAFEREKQGSPVNPEACEWPETYFGNDIWFEDWPSRLTLKVIALDPSKGNDARRGDYSAFVLLGITADGLIYVQADLARRATPQIVADGVEWCRTFRPDALAIETNQFQDLLGHEFAAELARQGLASISPWAIDNRVNKLVRVRRLGPYLSRRQLRFRRTPATQLLVEQLQQFPVGDHDDGPDALEMAIRMAAELTDRPAHNDGLGSRLRLSSG